MARFRQRGISATDLLHRLVDDVMEEPPVGQVREVAAEDGGQRPVGCGLIEGVKALHVVSVVQEAAQLGVVGQHFVKANLLLVGPVLAVAASALAAKILVAVSFGRLGIEEVVHRVGDREQEVDELLLLLLRLSLLISRLPVGRRGRPTSPTVVLPPSVGRNPERLVDAIDVLAEVLDQVPGFLQADAAGTDLAADDPDGFDLLALEGEDGPLVLGGGLGVGGLQRSGRELLSQGEEELLGLDLRQGDGLAVEVGHVEGLHLVQHHSGVSFQRGVCLIRTEGTSLG